MVERTRSFSGGVPGGTPAGAREVFLDTGYLLALERRADKRYSLTDCVSFVLMWERGISVAFAFDDHFEQEGFVAEPRRG